MVGALTTILVLSALPAASETAPHISATNVAAAQNQNTPLFSLMVRPGAPTGSVKGVVAAPASGSIPLIVPPSATATGATQIPVAPPTVFSHQGITTTWFYVGEPADASNAFISNAPSAWDGQWETHYGGVDKPTGRNGYYPAGFTPKENPFYFALPYSDISGAGNRKSDAGNCPLKNLASSYSWCKNAWIAIRHNGKIVYAQWEDVGPNGEDDGAYVFGSSAPTNTFDARAGLDISPAVHDYLGLGDVSTNDWTFVSASQVPAGPWTVIVTTSTGDNSVN